MGMDTQDKDYLFEMLRSIETLLEEIRDNTSGKYITMKMEKFEEAQKPYAKYWSDAAEFQADKFISVYGIPIETISIYGIPVDYLLRKHPNAKRINKELLPVLIMKDKITDMV